MLFLYWNISIIVGWPVTNSTCYALTPSARRDKVIRGSIYPPAGTDVFTLHSGHVENVSRARYMYSQSPITQFLQGPTTMHWKCMYSPVIVTRTESSIKYNLLFTVIRFFSQVWRCKFTVTSTIFLSVPDIRRSDRRRRPKEDGVFGCGFYGDVHFFLPISLPPHCAGPHVD